jgi:hypothetical protein
MIESETGHREAGFRPVQAVTDFFVSVLLIGVNIKKVGRGDACSPAFAAHVTRHTSHVTHHTSHVTRHTLHVTRHTSHDDSARPQACVPPLQVTKQNDMIQDLSIMKKGVDPSIKCVPGPILCRFPVLIFFCCRYATYDDDVAIEMGQKPAGGAGVGADDDADESFDMKNYDVTYDKELAGSSSDDDSTAKSAAAAAAAAAATGSSAITDHLSKAQKKTMDM